MAKLINSNHMIYFVILLIIRGLQAYGVPYDNSFTIECLATPLSAQYGGGMVTNPELDEGLNGWTSFEDAKIAHVLSDDGNKFAVAYDRTHPMHSITQTFHLEQDKIYTFSAWVQVTDGEAQVRAVFKTNTGNEHAGWGLARKGCWKMMKGGLVAKISGPTQLYFETNRSVDVWVDSISLQSFSQREWKSHQLQKIQKVRQQKLRIQVMSPNGLPIQNATVSVQQTSGKFPFGCAMNKNILTNYKYQNWFLDRFNYATFENELKWYSTEITQGVEDYSVPDAMMQFAIDNKIRIRGHNVLWDDPSHQPEWVTRLSPDDLQKAVDTRIESVVNRYKKKLIHWDVVNENLHFNFFESSLNKPSSYFYDKVHKLDHKAKPFLNEYNTIENPSDPDSAPDKYINKVNEMRGDGYEGRLGIGLEGHFVAENVNIAYIRASLEALAGLKLSIWITELDIKGDLDDQVANLGPIINELFSHEYVKGIVLWTSLGENGCYEMCLTDYSYKNLPTGDVIDGFVNELKHKGKFDSPATTDSNGFFEASVYHGDYEVYAMHPNGIHVSDSRVIKVTRVRKHETESRTHRFTFDIEN